MPSFQDGSLFAYAPKAYLPTPSPTLKDHMFAPARRKQKQSQIAIPDDENVLLRTAKRLKYESQSTNASRWPRRIETNGVDLAYAVRKHAKSTLPIPSEDDAEGEEDDLNELPHPGLLEVYQRLPKYLTPLDVGEFENLAWTQKYAPQRAEHVLQGGHEATTLRDWLKRLTVTSVNTGKSRPKSKPPPPRKRKKRPRGLNGFIVSSDEEDNELVEEESNEDFGNELKSLIRNSDLRDSKKLANAVLLSGPSGCGKTAAVYAAAKELGFDVFEVNAGDRRSGKDILEKVGEMSQTHHVDHSTIDDSTKKDIESGKQSTLLSMFATKPKPPQPKEAAEVDKRPRPPSMSSPAPLPAAKKSKPETSARRGGLQSFFTPLSQKKAEQKPKPEAIQPEPKSPLQMVLPDRSSPNKPREPFAKPLDPPPKPFALNAFNTMRKVPKAQKQSLILIEEVDIRYEEDKPFWSTIATLINESKRPIVMTCNDETLVPMDSLNLHAILRCTPPPEDLAADYLQTIAALEGHLVRPKDAKALYRINNFDLRRSLIHMNFWCQMGVGGRMSGLDWLIARWPPGCDLDQSGLKRRLATEQAYKGELELFPSSESEEQQLLLDLWEHSGIDVDDPTLGELADYANHVPDAKRQQSILSFDLYLDSLSAADTFGSMRTEANSITLDPTHAPMHKADVLDHTGHPMLEAHETIMHRSLSAELSICCKTLAKSRLCDLAQDSDQQFQSNEHRLLSWVLNRKAKKVAELSFKEIKEALLPISQSPKDIIDERQLAPTVICESSARLFVDVAPYVRAMVNADVAIAELHLRQSNLLSQGGKGKRLRTTRASRSAQGWESRAAARPTRWFTDKLNSVRVLRTGGNWQRLVSPKPAESLPSAPSSSPEDST